MRCILCCEDKSSWRKDGGIRGRERDEINCRRVHDRMAMRKKRPPEETVRLQVLKNYSTFVLKVYGPDTVFGAVVRTDLLSVLIL